MTSRKCAATLATAALGLGAVAAPLTFADTGTHGSGSTGKAPTRSTAIKANALERAIPVRGSGQDGTFAGVMKLKSFSTQDGKLVATARLIGTVTNGADKRHIDKQVTVPATLGQGAGAAKAAQVSTCSILHLVLGPLDLNVLGLRIQLNQVNLRITGQRGPGNLLGNLLCAVAGLLNLPPVTPPVAPPALP